MADNDGIKFFGFEFKKATKKKENPSTESIVPPVDEDGAGYVTAAGSHFGQYMDIDGDRSKDNFQLIQKYRGVAMHPEVDAAISDIVDEAITIDDNGGYSVTLNLDLLSGTSVQVKNKINDEFENIIHMLKFNDLGHDIFRRWYVDGRIVYHMVIDDKKPGNGIHDIRPIDSAKIRKVKEIKNKKDPITGAKIVEKVDEYFIYQEKPGNQQNGVKLTKDSIVYTTSGLLDASQKKVVSHLQKALKPINQLRMMEDSLVIYRLARAPERRIFYIDTGNLPKNKAEEYMKGIMSRYRNKLVYDISSGELKDDRKHMSMLEDFWLPRKEGGRGTEISTLPGGENLGQIDDIIYFQKRMYKSLNVPSSRVEQEDGGFNLGRASEISRDELKFQKFIDRLRNKFTHMFEKMLKTQLLLKNIITEEDWDLWARDIRFEFVRDSYFAELKDAEIFRERLQTVEQANQFVGEFFSKEYIWKKILLLSEEEIEEIKKQIDLERAEEEINNPEDDDIPQDDDEKNNQEKQIVVNIDNKPQK